MIFSTKPSRREITWGGAYLACSLFLLPTLLNGIHILLGAPLRAGQLNFLYFCINFAAVAAIFRSYLGASLRDAWKRPIAAVWYAVLAYLGNHLLSNLVLIFCYRAYPGFSNVNDSSFAAMAQQDYALMVFGACLLVPVAEEVLYRGLMFRSIFDRSPLAAYVISMTAFAAIHVVGYVGRYEPLLLLLCFLQYLPAGYCLAFAYHRSGTIAAPILMHILTNIAAMSTMR